MKKLTLLLFLIISQQGYAQKKSVIDSLNNILDKGTMMPTKRVDVLNELAMITARTDSAKTYSYALKAKPLAEKLHYQKGVAVALQAMGLYQAIKGHISIALNLLHQAEAIYISLKDNSNVGVINNYIGNMYKLVNNHPEGITYLKKAEKIHREVNDQKNLATDLIDLGAAHSETSQKDKALSYYMEATKYSDMLRNSSMNARLFINIGNLMREHKNYDQAMIYYDKAINIFKGTNDQLNLGIVYLSVSIIYAEWLKYDLSEKYILLAIASFTDAKFAKGLLFCYNNFGGIYIRQGKDQQALTYLEKAAAISREAKNYTLIAQIQQNTAFALTHLGRFNEAEKLFKEAEVAARVNHNERSIFGEIYNHWSSLDSARGDFMQAFYKRNKYLQIKDSVLNTDITKQIHEVQTRYETALKQKQIDQLSHEATVQQLKLAESKLQLNNQQLLLSQNKLVLANQNLELNKRQSLIARKQLEAQQKQQQIQLLNRENTIQKLGIGRRNTTIGLVSGILLVALVLGGLFYNRYKLKQEARLQTEVIHQQDLATKGIIEAEERERKRIAGDLHDGIGQLFSTVRLNLGSLMEKVTITRPEDGVLAEKTIAMVDESCKEVRSIAHQMMPNILLKTGLASAVKDFISKIDAEKLKVTVETAGLNERLSNNIEIVLYRIIQECVNNVIKHAQATRLDIQLDRSDEDISVMIEDNGLGFDTSDRDKFEGIGLKNIQTRLAYLKGTVDFSSSPGKGTLVAIYVPLV